VFKKNRAAVLQKILVDKSKNNVKRLIKILEENVSEYGRGTSLYIVCGVNGAWKTKIGTPFIHITDEGRFCLQH